MSEHLDVLAGADAQEALARKNDAAFFEPGKGITRVDRERWAEAQRYERRTWMEAARSLTDDRNRQHRARFAGYEALAGGRFHRAIELGCGPFTNLRLILEVARAREVHLLDPLALEYLRHPLCRYRGRRFGGVIASASLEALLAWRHPVAQAMEVANAIRVGGVRGRPVTLHAMTLEEFEPQTPYDLVVLVNVLEHCRDADVALANVRRALARGGTIVFHEQVLGAADVERTLHTMYDAGHPLRITSEVVGRFLAEFTPLFRSEIPQAQQAGGVSLTVRNTYFIGRLP